MRLLGLLLLNVGQVGIAYGISQMDVLYDGASRAECTVAGYVTLGGSFLATVGILIIVTRRRKPYFTGAD